MEFGVSGLVGKEGSHLLTDRLLYKGIPFLIGKNGETVVKEGQEFVVKEFLDLLFEKINPQYSTTFYTEVKNSSEKEVVLAWQKEEIDEENLVMFFKQSLYETAKKLTTKERESYFIKILEDWLCHKRGFRNIFVEIFQDYLSEESKSMAEKRGHVDSYYEDYCKVFYLPLQELRDFDKNFLEKMRMVNFKELMIGGSLTKCQTFPLIRMEITSLHHILSQWFPVSESIGMHNEWMNISNNFHDYGSKNLISFINQLDASWIMKNKDVLSDDEYRKYEHLWKKDFLKSFKDESYSKRITEFLVSLLVSTKEDMNEKDFATELYEVFNESYLKKEYEGDSVIFHVNPNIMLKMQYFLAYAPQMMEKERVNKSCVHEISFNLDMHLRRIDDKKGNLEIDRIQGIEINELLYKEEIKIIEKQKLPIIKNIYWKMFGDDFSDKIDDLRNNGISIEILSKEKLSNLGNLGETISLKCPKMCESNIEKILREIPLDNKEMKSKKAEVLLNEILFKKDIVDCDIKNDVSTKKHKKF